jgi:alkylation response protein AidB-like acyl-CoA dehydrogenase
MNEAGWSHSGARVVAPLNSRYWIRVFGLTEPHRGGATVAGLATTARRADDTRVLSGRGCRKKRSGHT